MRGGLVKPLWKCRDQAITEYSSYHYVEHRVLNAVEAERIFLERLAFIYGMIGRCGSRIMPLYSLPGIIPGVVITHLRATSFWLPARATMPNIHVANCKEGLPLPPALILNQTSYGRKKKKVVIHDHR